MTGFTCSRCGAKFDRNEKHIIWGRKSPVVVRRVSLLGSGNYICDAKDICDDCITSFNKWFKEGKMTV